MKKLFTLIGLALCCALSLGLQAQKAGGKVRAKQQTLATDSTSKVDSSKHAKPAQLSAYDRLFKDKPTLSSSSKFLTLHKVDGKVYIELPRQNFGDEMLFGITISSVSNPRLGMLGFKNSNPIHTRFVQKDSVVVLEVVNTTLEHNTLDKAMSEATKINYGNLSFLRFPIVAHKPDSTSVVFDVSSFFLRDNRFFPIITSAMGGLEVNSQSQDNLTLIKGVKAFDDNACVHIERSYQATITSGSKTISNYPVTIGLNYTLLRLPRQRMTPRLADSRIGFFQLDKVGAYDGAVQELSFIKRWRLVPKDELAYARGELCEPIKPIVYYIEPTFPPLWSKAIEEGILRWNKAFERIGFKNAVQARPFPSKSEDPEFDPDNFKYSCIRYIPIGVENAMGPSWSDPRTGEIINASVQVFSDISKVIDSWRFTQTAQLDERVRTARMPDDILHDCLAYVVGHEVGHTLGLMHNMGASAAFPTDSLRSASFTRLYGTTPSIMDYARFNYIAQPSDKGVKLIPPQLGVYDLYAIEWGYRYFPSLGQDFRAEARELSKLIDRHAGDPLYRYGTQQFGAARYDPSSLEEDLGNDPIKGADYGLSNLRYILQHLEEWIPQDEDSKLKSSLYHAIAEQAYRYASFVFMNISGIYLDQTSEASGLPRYKVVPKAQQRASALWLLRMAREFESMGNSSLEGKLPTAGGRPFALMGDDIRAMSLLSTNKLGLTYYLDSTSYSPMEYLQDVYDFVWHKTLNRQEELSEGERKHQQLYITNLLSVVEPVKQVQMGIGLHAPLAEPDFDPELRLRELRHTLAQNLVEQSTDLWSELSLHNPAHLCGLQHGGVHQSKHQLLNFGRRYGQPEDLWGTAVNRSKDYLYYYLHKTQALLEQATRETQSEDLKTHYSYLLRRIRLALHK